jgi:hypothetical protein
MILSLNPLTANEYCDPLLIAMEFFIIEVTLNIQNFPPAERRAGSPSKEGETSRY